MVNQLDERIVHFYVPALANDLKQSEILRKLAKISSSILNLTIEYCFNVVVIGKDLDEKEIAILNWLLTSKPDAKFTNKSSILNSSKNHLVLHYGPRFNFKTAFSTNAVSICSAIGFSNRITRIEKSIIYQIQTKDIISAQILDEIENVLHDRMTEQRYLEPILNFQLNLNTKPWITVDVLNEGKLALQKISDEMNLHFDDWDLNYYTDLFTNILKRNPTSVECFDLAQSNSEHSRHWFFKSRFFIDNKQIEQSLIEMVMQTQQFSNSNNVIKFNDNSSAIKGFQNLNVLVSKKPEEPNVVHLNKSNRHITFTAETHNFPTGIAPFQGATTGPGGRIRDIQAAGRGGHFIAGTAGYSIGNLHIPGYELAWELENKNEIYPKDFARPINIVIEASNGVSDYGNKFGEPLINGFCRTFGQRLLNEGRFEYIKPILFSGGIGSIDAKYVTKGVAQEGMDVVKIGGPVYRIGVGGGAASSIKIQNESESTLNFNAVQRGDPEMEQKMNRIVRACIENEVNPIHTIHDQGAGGNGNVLKEIAEPKGARIYAKNFTLGDPTINTLELWSAEYQESNAILIEAKHRKFLEKVGRREKCQIDFVGKITNDGKITLIENENSDQHPVDLDLKYVLASMPKKAFILEKIDFNLKSLNLPNNLKIKDALNRVLRLPSVGSKRYLTNKVDRCVTGLVVQQQCIGYLHTPLADYGCVALSHFETCGAATSLGEQPIKGLISPKSGGQMTVAEAITNLMFVKITQLADVKCSGNWMWAAKMKGEGERLLQTCRSMCDTLKCLNVAIDGGKDSLSMAAAFKNHDQVEVVKSPGTLVISTYAPVPNINVKVTPLLNSTYNCSLVYIPIHIKNCSLDTFKPRLGGSALAQVYNQIGNECPSLDEPALLVKCFEIVQNLISKKMCTAGHDVSDGGLITCILEMAFASNCGLDINILKPEHYDNLSLLFAEECSVVIEVSDHNLEDVLVVLNSNSFAAQHIGHANWKSNKINIQINGDCVLEDTVENLRNIWESTSFELEKLQTCGDCAIQENQQLIKQKKSPKWKFPIEIGQELIGKAVSCNKPKVAVLREEGINGDREMIASLHMVGFEVYDLTIMDLLEEKFNLDQVNGLVFPGGFSYADVLGSAKGWAATIKYNPVVSKELDRFKNRNNTWSLGVCNGCQLMALIGWIGEDENGQQATLLQQNDSGRFECRFSSVRIHATNSIMLKHLDECVLGVWIAHGEGKFTFKHENVLPHLINDNLVALTYVDDNNVDTEHYPMNPNGSLLGIAGLVSSDGRHLAMMPHPERCTKLWQWPYLTKEFENLVTSPWLKMFHNAFEWSINNSN